MRLVLDTNVVVSALVWGGVPYKLIEAAAAGDFDLITSPALMAELRDVLGREHLALRLATQRSSVEQAIGFYGELAIGVSPLSTPRVVPGDVDDDHVIAAAVAGSGRQRRGRCLRGSVLAEHGQPSGHRHRQSRRCDQARR